MLTQATSLGALLSLSALSVATPGSVPQSSSVAVADRAVIDLGPTCNGIFEPTVAVGGTRRLAVACAGGVPPLQRPLRFATSTTASSTWTSGDIPMDGCSTCNGFVDPSIAYDSVADKFVIAAIGNGIRTATYPESTSSGFSSWSAPIPFGVAIDKPYLVPGYMGGTVRELYMVGWHGPTAPLPNRYYYARSRDGGQTWPSVGMITTPDAPTGVIGSFCAQPAVNNRGPLYVAIVASTSIQVLKGTDDTTTTDVHFESLRTSASSLLDIPLEYASNALPLASGLDWQSGMVPLLLLDPTAPGGDGAERMYLVYQDTILTGDNDDMDVLIVRLDRAASAQYWSVSGPYPVHDTAPCSSGVRPDQFVPSAVVDNLGRIHVTYYDSRVACQFPGDDQQFDMFYSMSTNQGASFAEFNLRSSTMEYPLDADRVVDNGSWSPREYNGIAYRTVGSETELTCVYSGTSSSDCPSGCDAMYTDCKGIPTTVLYMSKVTVQNP